MSKVIIHIRNEVWATIHGLKPGHVEFLWDKFGPYVEGYRYMIKYTLGQWDGKVRFFEKTGKTYVKLLTHIIPYIENWHYEIELKDDRNYFDSPPKVSLNPFPNEQIKLRPYQQQSVNLCIDNGTGIILAGTGAGKTLITAAISHAYSSAGYNTITIVPSDDLVTQTSEFYIKAGLSTGIYSGSNKNIQYPNVVATWQAIQYNSKILKRFQALIWDEAHGCKAQVASKLLNEDADHMPYKFGVTGTIPKPDADQMSLTASIGDILIEIPCRWLMDNGYLTEVQIEQVCLVQKEKQNFPDYAAEKTYLSRNEERMDVIADLIITKCEEYGNTLVLVNSIPFGEKLASMIDGAVFLYGATKKEDRKQQYDLFEEKDDIICIATTGIASTGISIDNVHCLMMIDAGKSFIKTIQSIGRSTRLAANKLKAYIIDVYADLKWSKKHAKDREKWYSEAHYPVVSKIKIKIN